MLPWGTKSFATQEAAAEYVVEALGLHSTADLIRGPSQKVMPTEVVQRIASQMPTYKDYVPGDLASAIIETQRCRKLFQMEPALEVLGAMGKKLILL